MLFAPYRVLLAAPSPPPARPHRFRADKFYIKSIAILYGRKTARARARDSDRGK
jgi:hypothetical protein